MTRRNEMSRPRRQSSVHLRGRSHREGPQRPTKRQPREPRGDKLCKKKEKRQTSMGNTVRRHCTKNMSHTREGQAVVRQVARTTHSYRMGHGDAEVTDRAGSIPQYAKDIEGGSRRPHSAPLATTSPGGAGVCWLLRPLFVLLFGL